MNTSFSSAVDKDLILTLTMGWTFRFLQDTEILIPGGLEAVHKGVYSSQEWELLLLVLQEVRRQMSRDNCLSYWLAGIDSRVRVYPYPLEACPSILVSRDNLQALLQGWKKRKFVFKGVYFFYRLPVYKSIHSIDFRFAKLCVQDNILCNVIAQAIQILHFYPVFIHLITVQQSWGSKDLQGWLSQVRGDLTVKAIKNSIVYKVAEILLEVVLQTILYYIY